MTRLIIISAAIITLVSCNVASPSKKDIAEYIESQLPAYLKVNVLNIENSSRNSDEGVASYKAEIIAKEDLFELPTSVTVKPINELINNFNTLAKWISGFKSTNFGSNYSNDTFEALHLPQLIVKEQAEGDKKSVYGRVKYQKQIDRWKFYSMEFDAPRFGKPISVFDSDTLVLTTPKSNSALENAKSRVAAMEKFKEKVTEEYAKMLLSSTKPGTKYFGTIAHEYGTFKVELEFTSQEQSGQYITFCIKNLNDKSYQWDYSGRLDIKVPSKNDTANLIVNQVASRGVENLNTAAGKLVRAGGSEEFLEINLQNISGIINSRGYNHVLNIIR